MFKHLLKVASVELKKQGITFVLSLISSILASWAQNVHSKDFVPRPDNDYPPEDVGKHSSFFDSFFSK